MKLRIRSTETKETIRIETPDPCSFLELRTLIAGKISSAAAAVDPGFVRISLNRKDELCPSDPNETLASLGLLAGDLLFFTLQPPSRTLTLTLTPSLPTPSVQSTVPMEETSLSETLTSSLPPPSVQTTAPTEETPQSETLTPSPSPPSVPMEEIPQTVDPRPIGETSDAGSSDAMDVEFERKGKTPSVPYFLKRVIEAEDGKAKDSFRLVVIAVHAAFLESSFVVCGTDGSRLPEGWALAATTISIRYTVPELLVRSSNREGTEVAVLKFAAMGNHLSVYGLVTGDRPEIRRVALDASKTAPLLASLVNTITEVDEKHIFEFWKIVKDELCLPLLIHICQKNGLPLPCCFARLPTELTMWILQLLPGVDLARIGCTNSELRYLTMNDELWKQKFLEEFGLVDDRSLVGRSFKDKFAACWKDRKTRKNAEKMMREKVNGFLIPQMHRPRYVPYWRSQRFPMIGGDYDLFPPLWLDPGRAVPRPGFLHHPARRNFSPGCDFGDIGDLGGEANFSDFPDIGDLGGDAIFSDICGEASFSEL